MEPGEPPPGGRTAFDPELGRLWQVCGGCGRWNAVPMEERWETLEACERLATDRGRILLRGERLSLLVAGRAQLVRVGEAPRVAFSEWRYSRRLDAYPTRRPGLFQRLLASLPERSAGGADYHSVPRMPPVEWMTSPFQEQAGLLTELFLHVPFAEACPSCEEPLALEPTDFGRVRLTRERAGASAVATCAFCGETSALRLEAARPALRVALAIVDRRRREPDEVVGAAGLLDRAGGPEAWVDELAREDLALEETEPAERIALAIGLDEQAEAEVLEAEWREAEELAAIMDGELTHVPGFEAFRDRVLGGTG